MNPITIYTANCRENVKNTRYPQKHIITNLDEFREALKYDHVCALYKNFHRSIDNFVSTDCLMMDCDNTHSDIESDWVTPKQVSEALPELTFYVCYSRNNGKQKGERSPRPKFHVYFQIDTVSDAKEYSEFKNKIIEAFPQLYFDTGAKDSARFFFGVEKPEVFLMGGDGG
ncbi:MAG: hypothetical protein WCQ41_03255 [Bacillota bacterium]